MRRKQPKRKYARGRHPQTYLAEIVYRSPLAPPASPNTRHTLTVVSVTRAPPPRRMTRADSHDAAASITGGFTFAVSDPQPYRINALRGHRNGSGQKLFQDDRLLCIGMKSVYVIYCALSRKMLHESGVLCGKRQEKPRQGQRRKDDVSKRGQPGHAQPGREGTG